MAVLTDFDLWNTTAYEKLNKHKIVIHYLCKLCGSPMSSIDDSGSHYEGCNFVCNSCITKMTTIFDLDKSDLDDIITNAGYNLKQQNGGILKC